MTEYFGVYKETNDSKYVCMSQASLVGSLGEISNAQHISQIASKIR